MPLLKVKNSPKEIKKMNKEVIIRRGNATLNQTLTIVLFVLGIALFVLGIVLYTLAIRNDNPMIIRILFLVLFGVVGVALVTLGVVQVFDNDENKRLYSFPLLSYSKEEDLYYAYNLKEGGSEITFKKENLVKLSGPSFITFGRVNLKYKKDGETKTAFIGFARLKDKKSI